MSRVALSAILLLLLSLAAQAQPIGNLQRGAELATDTCAECHAIRDRQLLSPNPRAPTFYEVANRPGMTATAFS
jgi:mono/diheme cytochrome c family protein